MIAQAQFSDAPFITSARHFVHKQFISNIFYTVRCVFFFLSTTLLACHCFAIWSSLFNKMWIIRRYSMDIIRNKKRCWKISNIHWVQTTDETRQRHIDTAHANEKNTKKRVKRSSDKTRNRKHVYGFHIFNFILLMLRHMTLLITSYVHRMS